MALVLWTFLVGCVDDRTAGTSSTTGNPTKVSFGFQQGGVAARVTGRAQLYENSHIPVFDSTALAVYDLKDEDSLIFTKDSMEAILSRVEDSVSLAGPDSIMVLNVVVSAGQDQGAILTGIRYHIGQGTFQKPEEWTPISGRIALEKVTDFQGDVSVERSERLAHFLYIPGTPFYSRLENDGFTLKNLPLGNYEVLLMPVATSRTASTHSLESQVISLGKVLTMDEHKTYTPGAVMDTVRVPDSWWLATFEK